MNIETLETSNILTKPILSFGKETAYYSHGISLGNHFLKKDINTCFFMGWKVPAHGHWFGQMGEIIVDELGRPEISESPIFPLDEEDPISLSYPWIIKEDGVYKMWYGSTIRWENQVTDMIHVLKYATSIDGVNWVKKGQSVPFIEGKYQAFSSPTVIKKENTYHCWYSFRPGDGTPYQIGYAKSNDGLSWKVENEKSGIETSNVGWDSQMVCYPFVFQHKEALYMLYNGNGFGKTGIGIAKWIGKL